MKNLKLIFVAVPFIGGILGASYEFMNRNIPAPLINQVRQPITAKIRIGSAEHIVAASTNPLSEMYAPINRQNPLKTKKLPGIFRGDWGETPVYDENDRVNYQGAAYLSLVGENQDQPPSLSLAFWRMVKKANDKNVEACFLPGPNAKLGECNFSEGNSLKDMDLTGADLSRARLNGELGAANLKDANLSGAAVTGVLVISPDTQIDHANLAGLQSGGNNPVIAESANLTDTNFSNANLYGAKMKGANLEGAKLTGAILSGADLASTRLEGTDLSETDLTYANLSGADFSGADLRGANMADAQGADSALIDRQTDFTSAICPDGVTVDGAMVTTCVGHGF